MNIINIHITFAVMQDTWDIQNPAKLNLPSSNAAVCYDVRCIAAVGNNEIWIGAGPSIFFLDETTLERCVSVYLQEFIMCSNLQT